MLEAHIAGKSLPSGELLLRDVRFSVKPGEIVAVLGASGIGKTSVLRILLGLDSEFQGTLRITATRVGAMFQEPRLLPWLTIGDNIKLVVAHGQKGPDVASLLRGVGLGGSATLFPRQMSLGMARRAALARALAIAPDLLILDEPFASLDPQSSASIAALLRGLRHAGIVIALHDIARATTLATRIVVLAGRPASVAYEASIPADADEATRTAIRTTLEEQFPFTSEGANSAGRHRLAVAPIGD